MSEGKIDKHMLRDRAERLPEVDDSKWKTVNLFNRNLVDEYLMESTQLSPKTLEQYRSGLRQFFVWVHETLGEEKKIFQIKKKEFLRFQNMLVRRGMSSSAIKFKRSAVSSFNKYIINFYEDDEDFKTFRNFVEGVPNPELNKTYEKIPLSKDEIELITKTLEEENQWQILAIFHSLYAAGCRRGEIIQLRKEIANYEKPEGKNYYVSHMLRGKGRGVTGKNFKILLDDTAMQYIHKWLEVRGEDDNEYLFVTKYKGELKQANLTTVNYWFQEIISDIVGRRVNVHIMRSTRATHILEDGGSVDAVKSLLKHESSETTTKFYDLRNKEDEVDDIF